MLGDDSIAAFLPTRDGARTRRFYEQVIGLRLVSDEPWAIVFDAAGTTVRIQKVESFTPHPFTALGWEVPDVEAAVAELGRRSVRFERYPGMEQDERGIWRSPGGARVAWFKDPDGNTLSITQL